MFKFIKIFKKISYEYIVLLISFFLALLIWEHIELGFENNQNITSIISLQKFNPINNDLRFIFLTSFSLFSYYFFKNYRHRFKHSIIKTLKLTNYQNFLKEQNNNKPYYFFFFLLSCLIFEFFFQDLPKNNLDFFHEGEWLTPAFHYLKTGNLYSDLYFTHGFFYDFLKPILAWKIFSSVSIGAVRYFDFILILFTKVLLLILSFRIGNYLNISNYKKFIFIIFLNLIFIEIISYNTFEHQYFTYRDIFLIILLILSLEIPNENKLSYVAVFFVGFLSLFTIFLTIDRGMYYSFITIFIFFTFILQKKYKNSLILVLGILFSYFFLRLNIPLSDLMILLDKSLIILKTKPLLDNYIFPTPFFDGDTTSTKALLTLILGGILVINFIFNENKKFRLNKNIVFFCILLLIISFIVFKNALGRSDVGHIKYSLGFNYLLISFLFAVNILLRIKPNFQINNNFFYISVFIFILFLNYKNFNSFNFRNINNPINNIKKYLNLEDSFFISEKNKKLLEVYSRLLHNQDCEMNLTNEPAWAYLLKKKSCTKFYVSWFSASDYLQNEYIKEIKEKKIKYILYSSDNEFLPDGLDNKTRINLIVNFLEENYTIKKNENYFKIAELN